MSCPKRRYKGSEFTLVINVLPIKFILQNTIMYSIATLNREYLFILQNNKSICMPHYITIQDAVSQIKQLIETAIIEGGCEAKNNLIRTSIPI